MATLSRITKKAAYSVIPLAKRRTPHRNYTSPILCIPLKTSSTTISTSKFTNLSRQVSRATSIPPHISAPANKGSNSEDTLLSMIESAINFSEDEFHESLEAPRDFPFKIEDNAGEKTITLTREFQDEEIKVTAQRPYDPRDRDRGSLLYQEEDCEEKSDPPQHVRLIVNISKKSGLTLVLNVAADTADGIEINSILRIEDRKCFHHLTHEQPHISDLDKKLQKAFHTFLEVRGIEPSIGKFLCDYMVQRKDTKRTKWLKYLKNFISFSSNDSNRFGEVSRATSIPCHHQSSALAEKKSNSDDTFLRVVKSEIECAEEEFHEVISEALREFPFKIEEVDAGKRTITLTREYQGDEEIKVTVDSPYFGQCLCLNGIVLNKSGLTLEFYGLVDRADVIRITSLQVKDPNASDENIPYHCYQGPTFRDLDEKVKNAFGTYLEDRGIEPNLTKILYDCIVNKKHKKHTRWLRNLKNFIAN